MLINRSIAGESGYGFGPSRMPETYTLRHDIPIPLKSTGLRGRKHGPGQTTAIHLEPSRKTMLKMGVGQSFVVPIGTLPGKNHSELLGTISLQAGYILGRDNFVTVAVQDGVCVWRVK